MEDRKFKYGVGEDEDEPCGAGFGIKASVWTHDFSPRSVQWKGLKANKFQ